MRRCFGLVLALIFSGVIDARADVTMTGDVSSNEVGNTMVGRAGDGRLVVDGGSTFETTELVVGSAEPHFFGGLGEVLVRDPGTTVILSGSGNRVDMNGVGAAATMTIKNGAIVDGTVAPEVCLSECNFFIGNGAGSNALLTIVGAGSRLDAMNIFAVASGGVHVQAEDGFDFGQPSGATIATVNVRDGAVLNTHLAAISLGPQGGTPTGEETTEGTVIVDGSGSAWNVDGVLHVADARNATGLLFVTHGGSVNSRGLIVGGASGGSGALRAMHDGSVTTDHIEIGRDAGSDGRVLIVGGSVRSASSNFSAWWIGASGKASLQVSEGGTLIHQSGPIFVAATPSSEADVTVDGEESLLDAGDVLALGLGPGDAAGGKCTLTIGKEGIVRAGEIRVGPKCQVNGSGTLEGNVLNLGGKISKKLTIIP